MPDSWRKTSHQNREWNRCRRLGSPDHGRVALAIGWRLAVSGTGGAMRDPRHRASTTILVVREYPCQAALQQGFALVIQFLPMPSSSWKFWDRSFCVCSTFGSSRALPWRQTLWTLERVVRIQCPSSHCNGRHLPGEKEHEKWTWSNLFVCLICCVHYWSYTA